MVDQWVNVFFVLLLVLLLFSLKALFEPRLSCAPLMMKQDQQVPQGWTQRDGRWVCDPVSAEAVEGLIRVLPRTAKQPRMIRIDPPKGEVIW